MHNMKKSILKELIRQEIKKALKTDSEQGALGGSGFNDSSSSPSDPDSIGYNNYVNTPIKEDFPGINQLSKQSSQINRASGVWGSMGAGKPLKTSQTHILPSQSSENTREYSVGIPESQKNRLEDILNSGLSDGPKPYDLLRVRGKSAVSIKYTIEPASEGFFNCVFYDMVRETFYRIVTRLNQQGIETIGADTELSEEFIQKEFKRLKESHNEVKKRIKEGAIRQWALGEGGSDDMVIKVPQDTKIDFEDNLTNKNVDFDRLASDEMDDYSHYLILTYSFPKGEELKDLYPPSNLNGSQLLKKFIKDLTNPYNAEIVNQSNENASL